MAPTAIALSTPRSPCRKSGTPPNSPRLGPSQEVGTVERIEQAVQKLVQALEKDTRNKSEDATPEATKEVEAEKPKIRASRLAHKQVDECWEKSISKYKIVDSSAPPEQVTELDEYVFIIRARTDRTTFEQTFYVDIKSEELRDILRIVLRDVRGLSLRDEHISVERNLLYHFVTQLKLYRVILEGNFSHETKLKHLSLLMEYLESAYASTAIRLASYIKNGEITYDLLWALFKPDTTVFTTILDVKKPACYIFESGGEKTTNNGTTYFHISLRFLDFNGQVFGEAPTAVGISRFEGSKRIDRLEAFPLDFHRSRKEMREHLVRCGRRFGSLMGSHHVQYHGNAYYIHKGEYVEVPVDSRVMVDVAYFRKVDPNYTRPHINELARPALSSDGAFRYFSELESDEVKSNGFDINTISEDDLMICSQTVYGWSFGNKQWLEFAVDDIEDIVWNPSSFDNLAIAQAKKEILLALAKAHVSRRSDDTFDDFVVGKGQGLIALLHGPPGVGKTLTAEGLSEYLKRPLYAVSAGELGHDPKPLEEQLSRIFHLAHHWDAIVLFDEVDVFVQTRSIDSLHNARVSVFLRTLEYFRGIMFFTTNRVKDIDSAIQSRISVALQYTPLGFDTRKEIWTSFLKKVTAVKWTPQDLNWLAQREVNGRQIKNIVKTAQALAASERTALLKSHLITVIDLDKEFQEDYNGAGQMEALNSYA